MPVVFPGRIIYNGKWSRNADTDRNAQAAVRGSLNDERDRKRMKVEDNG